MKFLKLLLVNAIVIMVCSGVAQAAMRGEIPTSPCDVKSKKGCSEKDLDFMKRVVKAFTVDAPRYLEAVTQHVEVEKEFKKVIDEGLDPKAHVGAKPDEFDDQYAMVKRQIPILSQLFVNAGGDAKDLPMGAEL